MSKTQEQLEALQDIRSMMERSSRFLSLSGLSGVWAGVCALAGAAAVYSYLNISPFDEGYYYEQAISTVNWGMDYKSVFVLIAFMVLVTALLGGVFFTTRKARAKGHAIWDSATKRLLWALAVPLIVGGIFCAGLFHHDIIALVAPATLLFYGLALVSASRYTVRDIEWLGYSEIALGVFGVFLPGFGLELWAVGFGFLHIFYGAMMYYKYER